MNKKKLLLLGLILFVPFMSVVFREEVHFESGMEPEAANYEQPCLLAISIGPTAERPGGGFCYSIDGTGYGWPAKAFAVATWEYSDKPYNSFEENPYNKTAYRWRFYPRGLLIDLAVMALVSSPFLYRELANRKLQKK